MLKCRAKVNFKINWCIKRKVTVHPVLPSVTLRQQQQQPFYGPLTGTTWVSWYQKKHSPTYHPHHHLLQLCTCSFTADDNCIAAKFSECCICSKTRSAGSCCPYGLPFCSIIQYKLYCKQLSKLNSSGERHTSSASSNTWPSA